MNVTSIRSRRAPGGEGAARAVAVPGGLRFLGGAALLLLLPTLLFCVVVGEWWPLLLMAFNDALGLVLGLALYAGTTARPPACVPETRLERVSEDTGRVKKAA